MRLAPALAAVGIALAACSSDSTETDGGGAGGASASAASSSVSAASSSSSASASSSSASSSSSTGGATCTDDGPGEPNDTEAMAHDLGTITDDDDDVTSVLGVIDGDADEDWYRYTGSDESFAFVDPERQVAASESGIVLCKYFECAEGLSATSITCPEGSSDTASSAGRPGCCKAGAGFGVELECDSSDDTATVYLRVHQPDADADTCNSYKVTYHF